MSRAFVITRRWGELTPARAASVRAVWQRYGDGRLPRWYAYLWTVVHGWSVEPLVKVGARRSRSDSHK